MQKRRLWVGGSQERFFDTKPEASSDAGADYRGRSDGTYGIGRSGFIARTRKVLYHLLAFVPLLLWVCGCVSDNSEMKDLGEILQESSSKIMAIDGVVGVGEGRVKGEPAVIVLVSESSEELEQKIRDCLPKGVPLSIRGSGPIKARPE